MSSGAKRGGSNIVVGTPLPRKPYGTYKEFQRKDYLPAEVQIRAFLQDVAKRGDRRLSFDAQWLLARYWKCVLPRAAKRLTSKQRADLTIWVPGSTIRAKQFLLRQRTLENP